MDDQLLQSIAQIHWFRSCGAPITTHTPLSTVQVSSWFEAMTACSDQAWEDVTLEASNCLSKFLHAHHRDAYQHWNSIVDNAKQAVIIPLAERSWRPYAEANGLGKPFVDSVSWDVLAAVMEHEYRSCVGRPDFFLRLMEIYQAGHFPCGWRGKWPNGNLLVW